MFEWLEREISEIKTTGFHLVDGPADAKLCDAIKMSPLQLPSSYIEFVLKFGNAKLYKNYRNNSYQIGVFAGPRSAVLEDGTNIYHIGFHEGASVYIKESCFSDEGPIFEFEEDEEEVANSFEEWLTESCANARASYNDKAWEQILHGPPPFTSEEKGIVKARRLILWKIKGIDVNGDHIFEIINQSQRSLAAITVGVRSKDGRLNGAVRLDISQIGPGQSGILHVSCYKKFVPAELIEIFPLPDPKPEDRDYYWEFKTK